MESQLIHVVRKLIVENNDVNYDQPLTLSLSINKHLGLDSLGRAELFSRIENEFNVRLSDQVMCRAETLQDIVNELKKEMTATPYFSDLPLTTSTEPSDPSHVVTLCDLLILHAKFMPERPHIFIQSAEKKEMIVTYHDLLTKAQIVASYLVKQGLQKSDTVAIMLPTSEDFFYSFFGVLLAGGIPVPIYPPTQINHVEIYIKKETLILSNAMVRYLITLPEGKLIGYSLKSFVPTLREIIIVDSLLKKNGEVSFVETYTGGNDIALIQYTSGSTNHPKGVVLTHYNILSNIRAYGEAIQINSNDVCISWLPLYHDLGLIGNWLGSLYFGVPLIVFSPIDFLNRPERWLQAIHHYRGTISAAPNFAYELCVNKLEDTQLKHLDLSSWRIAVNGAEIIQPETLKRFYEKFSSFGLREETLLPVYGLAENSLGLTASPLNRKPLIDKIDRDIFEREQRAVPSEASTCLQFVSCGKVIPNHQIRIVNDEGTELPERYVGNIQFQGPSSMQGYWNDQKATSLVYHEGWWDTGDLGYMVNGEIVITGRKKDIIIKAGRNYIAADIENVVAKVPGIRRGCVVALSVNHAEKKKEELIIIAETSKKDMVKLQHEINIKINETINIQADKIILVPPKTIPKTSSGKLQRASCKRMYLENNLTKKPSRLSVQIARLALQTVFFNVSRLLQFSRRLLQTMYVGMWVVGTFPLIYFLILLTSKKVSRQIVGGWFKMLFFINFVSVKVQGKENAAQFSQQIFIANHSSYMDVVFLLAILPRNITIVCKKSLLKIPILKTFIKKLDYLPIEKYDQNQAVVDLALIKERLNKRESILLFPEGEFNHAKGLRPFKMGAFKLAVEMQIPLTPVITQGLREFLPRNAWLIKFNPLNAVIAQPSIPRGTEWKDMVALKNEAYSVILKNCGEPRLEFS